jgi:pullulanase
MGQRAYRYAAVDGAGIYMYGEGWDYAEVERNRVGVNACQLNLGGTGVGSFNDRLREGIMGGSPFGGALHVESSCPMTHNL